ncbi:MAG: BatA and WFA domain-containing protein [Kiritimatiellae bacterium]|nr:BatA and WFA domain-containing protein [Kiritimatiellia bacterium]
MSFGYPAVLWGLLAVPLPLLVHLFFRRRKSEIAFSTLLFFKPHRREWAMRRRIREAVLLALRCLTVAALVLAFAQPLLRSGPSFLGGRTQTVFLLDDTLSMDRRLASGETAFAAAVAKAGEVLETLSPGDSAALLFLSGREGVPFTRDIPAIRQRLEGAAVTGAPGAFAAGMDQVAAAFRQGREPNRELFILSDFQKNQFPARPVSLTETGCRTYLLPLSGGEANLALGPLTTGSRPKRVGSPFAIPYTVVNRGDTDRETTVRLIVDGAVAFSEPAVVPAGKTVEGRFEVVPDRAGSLTGAVEVDDAALRADNRRDFAVTVEERLKVLLIESELGNRTRPFHFFRAAIDPEPGTALNGIDTDLLFFDELTARNLREVAVAVIGNPGPVPASVAALLRDHLQNGGTLIWLAGPADTPETADGWLPPQLAGWIGERKTVTVNGITFQNGLSPLNGLIQRDLLSWKRLHTFTRKADGETVLAEVGGMPLLAEVKVGEGRLIVSTASMRRDCGNWPELKSFPIALIHTLTYAARSGIATAEAVCGAPVSFLPAAAAGTIRLRCADGSLTELPVTDGKALFTANWQTGVVTADNAYPRQVAVVPPEGEGDLATVPAGQLKARFAGGETALLKTDTPLDRQIAATRRGRDLSGLLLLLAFLCLLGETAVSYRKSLR